MIIGRDLKCTKLCHYFLVEHKKKLSGKLAFSWLIWWNMYHQVDIILELKDKRKVMNNELHKYLWNTYEFKKYAKLGRQSRNLFSIFKLRSFFKFLTRRQKNFIWRNLVSRDPIWVQDSHRVHCITKLRNCAHSNS